MSRDVIVVGAGTFGSQVAWRLAQSGTRVLLLDQHRPPHGEGAHHGQTRLYRQVYGGPGPYTALAVEALALWRELERRSRQSLFRSRGVLNLDHADDAGHRGKVASAAEHGVRVESLSRDAVRRRWPAIAVPDDYVGLWEPEAGVLAPEAAVGASLALALGAGATLEVGVSVDRVERRGDSVTVHAGGRSWTAERVVLTASAGVPALLPDLELPVEAVRQLVAWFEAPGSSWDADVVPGFTYNAPEGQFYGFPSYFGGGLKVGRHDTGRVFDASQPTAPWGSFADDGADLVAFASRAFPGLGRLARGAACRYDRTPDENFRIGKVDDAPLWYATGFSGHGFKFAPSIGAHLARWVNGGDAGALSAFGPGPTDSSTAQSTRRP